MQVKRPTSETIEDAAEMVRTASFDFTFSADVMTDEDGRVRRLKWVMAHKLSAEDRNLIFLYIEVHSVRRIATMLGLSKNTVMPRIRAIRQTIVAEYEKIKDKEI